MSELGPDARALLDAAREADDPTAADRARVRARLAGAIAASAAGGVATGASASAAGGASAAGWVAPAQGASAATSVGPAVVGAAGAAKGLGAAGAGVSGITKVVAALAVVSAVGGGAIAGTTLWREADPTLVPVPGEVRPARRPRGVGPEGRARSHAPARVPEVFSPVQAPSLEGPPARGPSDAPRSRGETRSPAPAPRRSVERDRPVVEARVAREDVSPSEVSLDVLPERVEPDPAPAPSDAPHPASTLVAELTLLRTAQAALRRGDPDGALGQLEAHRARFPDGELAAERDAAEVRALCDAGRRAEARASVARFVSLHPSSPLRGRVEGICE